MNVFKHKSTHLFGHFSTKYPHTADRVFINAWLYVELHVHGRTIFI